MQPVFDQDLALQDFSPLNVLPATCGMYLSTGLKAQMQRKMMVGSLLDKIPAPGLRRSSSRSSFPARPSLC